MAAGPITYTTTVPASRTIGEIQSLLAQHGASRIAIDYNASGEPRGLAFQLRLAHGDELFALPVDVPAMHALLVKQRRRSTRVVATPEQATRVAWRVMKVWVSAQLALVEAQQATLAQIMFPYLMVDGRAELTVFDAYQENRAAELTP